jgi:hypothetical protein
MSDTNQSNGALPVRSMDESQTIASGNDLLTALCKALDLKPEFVCRMVLDVTVTDIPMVYVETTVPSTKVEVVAECVRGVEVRVIGGDGVKQHEEDVLSNPGQYVPTQAELVAPMTGWHHGTVGGPRIGGI